MTLLHRPKESKQELSLEDISYTMREISRKTPEEAHQSILQTMYNQQKIIKTLMEDNKTMWEIIQDDQLPDTMNESFSSNLELTIEEVKTLILKEIKIGDVFYPSDVANKLGLDLMTVFSAINKLKEEKRISDNK